MKLTKKQEQALRSYCEYENIPFFTGDELRNILNELNINTSVTNLIRNGVINSVYRGKVYSLSGRNGTIEELLPRLFAMGEPYYLTGVYVYNAYGFIDQLASGYQVANRKIKKEKTVAGYKIIFRKLKQDYFYGINEKTCMLLKERAIIDFCYSYGYSRFAEVLEGNLKSFDINTLIDFACSYPINKIARRVLYGINNIKKLGDDVIAQVNSKSLITLTEKDSREGNIDKRFNIIINQ